MTLYALIAQLEALDIHLYAHEGKIRVRDPQHQLTDDHRRQIRALRTDLLTFLASAVPTNGAIQRRERTAPLPLSFAQQRLWLLDQLEPGSAAYNIPALIRLEGALNGGALAQSLDYLVARHESLRTTFPMVGDHAVQLIQPPAPLALSTVAVDGEQQAQQLIRVEATTPFDLAAGPLLRAKLLKISASEHLLLLTMHHIISDGWSLGVIVDELTHAYRAFAGGAAPTLPDLPVQYADFAVWQRDHLQGETLERRRHFWRQELAGAPALLALPTDRPRPAVQTQRGAHYGFQLDSALVAMLKTLAQEQDATLFMVLLAAFNVLLAQYSRRHDIVVGTPIANRNRAEIEGLIGFFVNTLALRTNLEENPTFVELLAQVRQRTLAAYEHQDLPFEQLVEELHLERSLSYNPLFQVMFALQNSALGTLDLPGLTATIQPAELPFARFDLSLNLEERQGMLAGVIEYSTDLFDETTVARMADHFTALLAQIVAHPDHAVLHLPLLTAAEQHQIVHEWNATTVDFGLPQTIHALFEEQVNQRPDAVAVVAEAEQCTYAMLNQRANQLAHYLMAQGVQAETLVAVAMPRSLDLVVSLLAVLKAGGAYVPIDPSYPAARIKYMLTDSAAPILLTQSQLGLVHDGVRVVAIDRLGETLAAQPVQNPQSGTAPDNLAYVIYTSGSTGQPKGVMIQHDGLYNLVRWHGRAFGVTAADRASQMANPAFDATGWEIFPYLTAGATLVFTPEAYRLAPAALADWFAEAAITIAFVPTPITNALLEAQQPLTLRQLLTGGDKLTHVPPANATYTLVNNYGPTENTVVATAGVIKPGTTSVAPHIGRAIDNVQIYLLNDALQPVPINVPGELYVGGVQLARGYWNRPDLTAERFITHPHFGRLYKTGDLCRWRADGASEFLGRTDFQVKLRGFRIELGEIENALRAIEGVRDAVVLAREAPRGEKQLVAYYVGDGATDTVRHNLAQLLPDYMVPTAVVALDALPLTPNGKLDRAALPQPTAVLTPADFTPPRNAFEAEIAAIWRAVLQVDQVGRHDDFFTLGGHSLLATQVVSRVRTQLNIDVPLKALFAAARFADFAEVVAQAQRSTAATIQPVARGGEAPLSFAQQRLWFLDQLEPESALYNISLMLRLTGQLDVAALAQSFTYLIARHESLRTIFVATGGAARQVIQAPSPVALAVTTVADEQSARQLATAEAAIPFDLRHGPLLRVHLLRLAEERHLLLLTMHHIISDGWSMGLLLKELTQVYRALIAGHAPTLPALPIQYADFALWQRTALSGAVLEQQLAFWRAQLTGAPPLLELPADRPRPATQSHRGAHYEFLVDAHLTADLNALAQRHNASLFMLLLAAFNVLLARYSRQSDIVVGSPVANRNHAELEPLIGCFVNMLALRTQLDDNPTFSTLLARVRETTLAAYAHQDLPFEQLVDALALERTLSYTPLFQAVLVLQNMEVEPPTMPQLTATIEALELGSAKFDLTLNLRESAVGLHGILEYSTDLFEVATIVRMAKHLQVLLAAIVTTPEQPVQQLPMLTAAEHDQLLHTWNQPTVDVRTWGAPQTIHARVAQQAERTPNAIALTFEQQQLTYGELNTSANQLAHRLIELGAGRALGTERLVAVVLERSPELVVSLLAVLKAGAAYVPIDPTYPSERIAFTLQDCGAQILLTERRLVDRLPAYTGHYLFVDDDNLRCYPATDPVTDPATNPAIADQPAYVIYTSGSTGQPKGALITHRNVWRLFAATDAWFGFNATDVWTLFHSFAFDFSVWEMWGALCYGGRLVIVPYAVSRDPHTFYNLLCAERVTVLNQTPSAFRQLIPAATASDQAQRLRYVIFGGEALDFESLRPWFARYGDTQPQLVNMYGITETTVHVTYQPIAAADLDRHRGRSRIGQPIPDLQLYILDEHQTPVPIGVPGELYVAGAGLARSYLNRPALTAERFAEHPALGRLYKTGDLCRRLVDGNIEYLGRTDFQVKIRGFRIELGEIENALLAQAAVREAVALVREDAGNPRIVAYLVGDINPDGLRQQLLQRLPEYMVPAAFVLLDAMPLTGNGKLDRRALPAPDEYNTIRATAYAAPETSVQKTIATVWAAALGIEQVGLHDNFFDLGGNSLLVITVCDALKTKLDRAITVVDLFQHPTIHALAHHLNSVQRNRVEPNGTNGHPPLVAPVITKAQDRADRQKQARIQRRQRA